MTPAEREGIRMAEQRSSRTDTLLMWAMVVLIVLLGTALAHARYSGPITDPAIASWFKNQHNAEGQWCCDESDGHEYDGNYSFNADGSVTVELNGKPHILPKHMVLTGGNPTGKAIWWFRETSWGHTDYCFPPGTLS